MNLAAPRGPDAPKLGCDGGAPMPDCRMAWQTTAEIAAFDAAAGAFLAADPNRNTLLLSIPDVLRRRGPLAFGDEPPRFGWYEDADGTVAGALLQTPPHPVLLTELPHGAAASLITTLLAENWPVPGVNAPSATTDAFVAAWCAATGASATMHMSHRLYVLGDFVAPEPAPPGSSRVAAAADLDLLTTWFTDCAVELGDPVVNMHRAVADRVETGSVVLWEVDGAPVSMAGVSALLVGGIRIGPVYTPKPLRRRGYAGAATAASCRLAYQRGAREISLFTDLDNPTSNALYQRLGFRPVEDRTVFEFEAKTEA